MEAFTLIKQVADRQLLYISEHGHAQAGCNGPYKNEDTPIRNTGHWIIIYAYLWEKTKQEVYLKAVKTLAKYILNINNYGISGSIRHRTDVRFDHTNGLIGQAWTIEALITAAYVLKDKVYYKKAKELFINQQFNEQNSIWNVVDCNGEISYDLTFNHQLWFAASGSKILDYEYDEKIDNQIKFFLNAANERLFRVYDDGLIIHTVNYQLNETEKIYIRKLNRKRKIRSLINNPFKVLKKKVFDRRQKFSFTEGLEKGYHLFDLYGFAMLKQRYGEMPIFKSEKLKMAIKYALDTDEILKLSNPCGGYMFNKFSYSYNSPAFEYPYVSLIFGREDVKKNNYLLQKHCELLYDAKSCSFTKNCDDPKTLDARIYELVYYLREVDKIRGV